MRILPFLGPYLKADPLDGYKNNKGLLIYLLVVITLVSAYIFLAENIFFYLLW